jgi:hypothetical protein
LEEANFISFFGRGFVQAIVTPHRWTTQAIQAANLASNGKYSLTSSEKLVKLCAVIDAAVASTPSNGVAMTYACRWYWTYEILVVLWTFILCGLNIGKLAPARETNTTMILLIFAVMNYEYDVTIHDFNYRKGHVHSTSKYVL